MTERADGFSDTSWKKFRTEGEKDIALKALREIDRLRPYLSVARFPVEKSFDRFYLALQNNDTVILSAPPGSGKSLEVGAWLLQIMGEKAKVAMTQPRRDAAENVAVATAARHGFDFGKDVCYTTSEFHGNRLETRLKIMTTAVLVNMFKDNPNLTGIDAVVVDEVHERDINIDLTMALLKRANKIRSENKQVPIKVVLVSATVDHEKFSKSFNIPEEGVVRAEGKMYSVKKVFSKKEDIYEEDKYTKTPRRREVEEIATRKVLDVLKSTQRGDILVFMPGIRRIENTRKEIEAALRNNGLGRDVQIKILHSTCTQAERFEVLKPEKRSGHRRIVISTNIAETSVTVPGIKYVVDSGLKNENRYDSASGLEAIVEVESSQGESDQRAGRGGRLEEGEWQACFTEEDFTKKEKYSNPEIKRLDLSGTALNLFALGIKDFENLEFVDQPESAEVLEAIRKLEMLGAIDEDRNLTEVGKLMSKLPLEPRLGRVVAEAVGLGCVRESLVVSLARQSKGFMRRDTRSREEKLGSSLSWESKRRELSSKSYSDWDYYLRLFDGYLFSSNPSQFCFEYGLDERAMEKIWSDYSKIIQEIKKSGFEISTSKQYRAAERALIAGFAPDHLVARTNLRKGVEYERVDTGDRQVRISSGSIYRERGVGLAVALDLSPGKGTKVVGRGETEETEFKYAVGLHEVKPEDLFQVIPNRVRKSHEPIAFEFDAFSRKMLSKFRYEFKRRDGNWKTLPDQSLYTDSLKAVEALYEALSTGTVSGVLYEKLKQNKVVAKSLEDFSIRSRGKMEWVGLKQWFVEKLGTADLAAAESKGDVNYTLKFDDICEPSLKQAIEEACPSTVRVSSFDFPVKYNRKSGNVEVGNSQIEIKISLAQYSEEQVLKFLSEVSEEEMQKMLGQIKSLEKGDELFFEISLPSVSYYPIQMEYKGLQDLRESILSSAVEAKVLQEGLGREGVEVPYALGGYLPNLNELGVLPARLNSGFGGAELLAYPYFEPVRDSYRNFISGFIIKYGSRKKAGEKNSSLQKELESNREYLDSRYMVGKIMDFPIYQHTQILDQLGKREMENLFYELRNELYSYWNTGQGVELDADLKNKIRECYETCEAVSLFIEKQKVKRVELKKLYEENLSKVQAYFDLASDEKRFFKPSEAEINIMRNNWRIVQESIVYSSSSYALGAVENRMRQILAAAEFYSDSERLIGLEDKIRNKEIVINQVFEDKHNGVRALPNKFLAIGPDGKAIPPDFSEKDIKLWRVLPEDSLFVIYNGPYSGGRECYKNSSFNSVKKPQGELTSAQLEALKSFENEIIQANAQYSGANIIVVRNGMGGEGIPSDYITGKSLKKAASGSSVFVPKVEIWDLPNYQPYELKEPENLVPVEVTKLSMRESQQKLDRLNELLKWSVDIFKTTFAPLDTKRIQVPLKTITGKIKDRESASEGDFTALQREIDKAINNSNGKLGIGIEGSGVKRYFEYIEKLTALFSTNDAIQEYIKEGMYIESDLKTRLSSRRKSIFTAIVKGEDLPTPEGYIEEFVNSL